MRKWILDNAENDEKVEEMLKQNLENDAKTEEMLKKNEVNDKETELKMEKVMRTLEELQFSQMRFGKASTVVDKDHY